MLSRVEYDCDFIARDNTDHVALLVELVVEGEELDDDFLRCRMRIRGKNHLAVGCWMYAVWERERDSETRKHR